MDQALSSGQGSDNNEVPDYGAGPLWGQGLDYSGNQNNTYGDTYIDEGDSELKARVDDVGTHVYDGPDIGTYKDPSDVTAESR